MLNEELALAPVPALMVSLISADLFGGRTGAGASWSWSPHIISLGLGLLGGLDLY
jgi:hypothetical protein